MHLATAEMGAATHGRTVMIFLLPEFLMKELLQSVASFVTCPRCMSGPCRSRLFGTRGTINEQSGNEMEALRQLH